MRTILFGLFLLIPLPSPAGDDPDAWFELLRSDIRQNKAEMIGELMDFSEPEAAAFWPIYREYEQEFRRIMDARLDLIREYSDSADSLTDDHAIDLMDRALRLQEERLRLRKKYLKRMERQLPGKTVAKFFQLEHQIIVLLDLQIASEMPLVR